MKSKLAFRWGFPSVFFISREEEIQGPNVVVGEEKRIKSLIGPSQFRRGDHVGRAVGFDGPSSLLTSPRRGFLPTTTPNSTMAKYVDNISRLLAWRGAPPFVSNH